MSAGFAFFPMFLLPSFCLQVARAMKRLFLLLILGLTGSLVAAEWVASPEPGWPQFRGPRRNGISEEKGLLQSWPEGGPRVIWTATNLGSGYSSPTIAGKTLFITGDVGDELHIFALDLQGNLVWKATNGACWKNPYPGARASVTCSEGRIYHMNGHGRVACFDARSGRSLWDVDMVRKFESRVPTWGIAECLLIDGRRVIVTPGGKNASMAALDRDSGQMLWRSNPLPAGEAASSASAPVEGPAYASPILIEVLGQRQIVGVTARHFLGVNADTGELQWQFEAPTRYEVLASSPVLCGDAIFVTGPDGGGGKLLRFVAQGEKIGVEQTWTSTLDTCHGGVVALGGFLYGSWYRGFNGWGAVNIKDGSVPYQDKEVAMGSVLYADARFYVLSQTGTMALVKPNPERWEIISRFEFVRERRNDVWAHPVILDGRLYLRHQQSLSCFDIRNGKSQPQGAERTKAQ